MLAIITSMLNSNMQRGTWLPEAASNFAGGVDSAFGIITIISGIFFVGICFSLLLFVWKYRRQPGQESDPSLTHHFWLEIVWSVIPSGLLALIFAVGVVSFLDMTTSPEHPYEIKAIGKMWVWSFVYPNGYVDDRLHVPVDKPVKLIMSSDDVIHSVYIPAFRVKQDAIPGRYTSLWFKATKVGEFDLFCAEYCGTKHSDMITKVVVHRSGEFEKWLDEASNFLETMSPAAAGELLYQRRGCAQCHSVDGRQMVGPSFYKAFGEMAVMDDNSEVLFDENYIRESILEPQVRARAGYRKVMPTYQGQLSNEEIDALIAFIKSLDDDEANQ